MRGIGQLQQPINNKDNYNSRYKKASDLRGGSEKGTTYDRIVNNG